MSAIVDLNDAECRRAMPEKWGTCGADVIPAWIAEMDFALAPTIRDALVAAIEGNHAGYPAFGGDHELGTAYAEFAQRRYGQHVEPEWVSETVDVTAGVRVALDVLSDAGPMIMPLPGYSPQLQIAQLTGRERVDLVVDPDTEAARIDLDQLDSLFAAGARTLLLTQPHNPWGRVFTSAELEGVRDVVSEHGARVISDEIHAPLALPGATHVSYLDIAGTHDHAVAIVAASKAFNTAGLRCAQLVVPDPEARERLAAQPMVRNDSWSPLGVIASIAAYRDGDDWLDALLQRLDQNRHLLGNLLAEHLPRARMRRLEGTYLAWIDLREYGHPDPAAVALAKGRVRVADGADYQPGLDGHIRLNIATSPDRLTEIVRRLTVALLD